MKNSFKTFVICFGAALLFSACDSFLNIEA